MLLIKAYGRPNKLKKVHIFKCETKRGYKTLCNNYPKGNQPVEGSLQGTACNKCKAIYKIINKI